MKKKVPAPKNKITKEMIALLRKSKNSGVKLQILRILHGDDELNLAIKVKTNKAWIVRIENKLDISKDSKERNKIVERILKLYGITVEEFRKEFGHAP